MDDNLFNLLQRHFGEIKYEYQPPNATFGREKSEIYDTVEFSRREKKLERNF